MSDETPNSYVNMYRRPDRSEYAGIFRYADRDMAVHIGTVTPMPEYVGTVPSDDEPNFFDTMADGYDD